MATIILAKDGIDLQVLPLLKARTTIGRRTYNDIVIDALGISGEHAVIAMSPSEIFFEDLDSTNGSQLNGQPVKKHFLQDGDIIELATHTIRYRADEDALDTPAAVTLASAAQDTLGDMRQTTVPSPLTPLAEKSTAVIKILKGIGAGKEIALTKTMTTIGRPGIQVAVLAKSRQGFSLTHIEGKVPALVNGTSIGAATCMLTDGDLIEMSGAEMVFVC
jgi:pSer/pThr/pTyr-binding forkhead associated (FHA) protein